MFYIAIGSLVAGVLCGQLLFSPSLTQWVGDSGSVVLLLLLFSVGVTVGSNKQVFQKLREHHVKMLIVPVGTVIGSILGGVLCAYLTDLSLRESVSIASAMGWYSLSSIMMTDLAGANVGAVAFLANMLREILAFGMIPFLARRLNHFTAIAPAGATSEDTTLPLLMRHTSPEVAVMAVFNGFLLSTLVPILMRLFMGG